MSARRVPRMCHAMQACSLLLGIIARGEWHMRTGYTALIQAFLLVAVPGCSSNSEKQGTDAHTGGATGTGGAVGGGANAPNRAGAGGGSGGSIVSPGGAAGKGGSVSPPGTGGYETCLVCGGHPGAGGTVAAAGGTAGSGNAGGRMAGGAAGTAGAAGAAGATDPGLGCAMAGGMCGCSCNTGTTAAPALMGGCPQPCPLCGGCSMQCCLPDTVGDAGSVACGSQRCRANQLCVQQCVGIGPLPAPHCVDIPPSCAASVSCGCLPSNVCTGGGLCTDSRIQGHHLECFGCL